MKKDFSSNSNPNNEPVKTPYQLKTIAAEKLQNPFRVLVRVYYNGLETKRTICLS